MGEGYTWPAMASYQDQVTELIASGAPFGVVEDAIDQIDDLPEDAKAALWLLAFSMREPRDHGRGARPRLASVG